MCDYTSSTQLREWLFSLDLLEKCRGRANYKARQFLATTAGTTSTNAVHPIDAQEAISASDTVTAMESSNSIGPSNPVLPVDCFAAGYPTTIGCHDENELLNEEYWTSSSQRGSHPLLTSNEEQLLIQFYSGKINYLIGPKADIPRCRRDIKVTATAALLFRRFYLSNSVMIHDPKAVMVAAAFLASKVEDATVDIRALEEATKHMQAHVTVDEIIAAELCLLEGVHSDLMMFHPYKTLIAYAEDLRTFLRSKDGKAAVVVSTNDNHDPKRNNHAAIISGEDLRPIHEEARLIVDDACVSDIPLLFTPGQIGLAAMMLANEALEKSREDQQSLYSTEDEYLEEKKTLEKIAFPKIDLHVYLTHRFRQGRTEKELFALQERIHQLKIMLRELKSGKFGCGNYEDLDMSALKAVHKKLKKCKAWGEPDNSTSEKKKKSKKRKADES